MKKLYYVTATFEYVIASDSSDDSMIDAIKFAEEAFKDISPYDLDLSIENYKPNDAGYDLKSYPYADGIEKNIAEWLK